ncbi:MAG: hypothetical protein GY804_02510 [Alphaproteobacteria bacterium]|nr:hypothetical protein [Alphaproteobacteria bacterium]
MKMKEEKQQPCVFIVNEGYHDYSSAEEYGKIVFMSSDPNGIVQYNTSSMARLFQPYIDSSSNQDYILVTSFTVMVCVASSMFAQKHGRVNLLIWRPGDKRYVSRTLIMKGKQDELSSTTNARDNQASTNVEHS